jgi:hypothetical protein
LAAPVGKRNGCPCDGSLRLAFFPSPLLFGPVVPLAVLRAGLRTAVLTVSSLPATHGHVSAATELRIMEMARDQRRLTSLDSPMAGLPLPTPARDTAMSWLGAMVVSACRPAWPSPGGEGDDTARRPVDSFDDAARKRGAPLRPRRGP